MLPRIYRSSIAIGSLLRFTSASTFIKTGTCPVTRLRPTIFIQPFCSALLYNTHQTRNMGSLLSHKVERLAEDLEKPELDNRSYRVIRLENQLEALLVHDPDTDKASASVNVNVGSFCDPEDIPGTAHAIEHFLFMGTKKYPIENAYSQYLSSHSGYSNAYTASTETNYFFEVAAEASEEGSGVNGTKKGESPLYGALDRFAQFFVAPLFLEDTLDRELRAVDSENKKNLQSDQWRLGQLDKSTSSPSHPYHKFSTGSLVTLRDEPTKRGVKPREEFIKWQEKHYSANLMKVVVLGKESLDQLEEWTAELFSAVPNKNLPLNRWDNSQPLTESEYKTQIFAKPVLETRDLSINFSYRDETSLYESQPSHYISHLIGHEGPGSILEYLRAKGWASTLHAGSNTICPGAAVFMVGIQLTPEGLTNYKEIVKVVFQYIGMIKEAGPQEWIVEEMKGLSEVDFRFKEKSPASRFTSSTSSKMQKPFPRDRILSGTAIIRKYDAEELRKGLDCLTPDNYRLTIVSQEYPGHWDKEEKWYGTEYKLEKVPQEMQEELRQAMTGGASPGPKELHLPHVNKFVPKNLHVEKKEVAAPTKTPILLRNEPGLRLWWKKDDQFWVPRAAFVVNVRSPYAGTTPAETVNAAIYADLVTDALVEYSYDAELAGLEYGFRATSRGLEVELNGYNDKMHVLLEKILTTAKELVIKPDRFDILQEQMVRGNKNWELNAPYGQVQSYMRNLGSDRAWTNEQILAATEAIQLEDVRDYFPSLFKTAFLEILAHGNLYKEDALRMTDKAVALINPSPYPAPQWRIRRSLLYPSGTDYTWKKTHADPANVNNCIEYYLQLGLADDMRLRALSLLFSQLTEEKCFDQLRTKEQLGYIVWSGVGSGISTFGYFVIIQSEKSCAYLEDRINAFLVDALKTIEEMPQDEFERHRQSIIARRQEKLKNLDSETTRFWSHVSSEYFNFVQADIDVENLKHIKREEIIKLFKTLIDPRASSTRAKLSVHVIAQTSPEELAKTSLTANDDEKRAQVLTLLSKYLTTQGVHADRETLESRFANISLTDGKTSEMISILQTYLEKDAKMDEKQTDTVIEQLKPLIATTLPSLGIEIQGEQTKEGEGLSKPPKVKETTWIEDVTAWKTGLTLTAGPRPVVDLSTYEEDVEAKL